MKTLSRSIPLSLGLAFAALAVGVQGQPPYLNYQGRLTDGGGSPLAGPVNLEFRIYDAPTGGTEIWGPQTFTGVALDEGRYNVVLGEFDEAGAPRPILNAFDRANRHIEITVDGGPPLSPRLPLLSAPYTIISGSSIAAGTTIPFSGTSPPNSHLLCDGSVVDAGASPELMNLLNAIGTTYGDGGDADPNTFNLPGSTTADLVSGAAFNIIKF